ncbi:MAG: hypothetical protein AAFZ18_02150 [Myxococcota bacterium]
MFYLIAQITILLLLAALAGALITYGFMRRALEEAQQAVDRAEPAPPGSSAPSTLHLAADLEIQDGSRVAKEPDEPEGALTESASAEAPEPEGASELPAPREAAEASASEEISEPEEVSELEKVAEASASEEISEPEEVLEPKEVSEPDEAAEASASEEISEPEETPKAEGLAESAAAEASTSEEISEPEETPKAEELAEPAEASKPAAARGSEPVDGSASATSSAEDADSDPGDGAATDGSDRPVANLLDSASRGDPDDLQRIHGVGPKLAKMLNNIGVFYFWQIAEWGSEDIARVDSMLASFRGRIERDRWVEQAQGLMRDD